jgi:membrane-associated phospholipid phosphatase
MLQRAHSEPPASRRGPLARGLALLGPDFSMFLLFLAVFVALGAIYGAHFHVAGESTIAIASGIAGGLLAVRFAWRARAIVVGEGAARAEYLGAARRILRDWGPLILLTVVFENLHAYTGLIRKAPIDDALYALDVRVFGVEPSVWAGRVAHPLLTDWMGLAYDLYFVLPMILATCLAARGLRHDFRELATGVVLHMCLGFLLFIVFPAGPPRFYQPLVHGQFQPAVLRSASGFYELTQGAFDAANPVRTNSSFPSMHCALATLTLCYTWRFGRAVFPRRPHLYFWICVPLVVSLWLSTVYLRHHWVPDCVAGIALGAACFALTPVLRRRWPGAEQAAST